ncbi:MAG TPA: CpaF family protein [Chloroflexota bacterium]|nr:CpaF family protein [Chloroflexota bacterium]
MSLLLERSGQIAAEAERLSLFAQAASLSVDERRAPADPFVDLKARIHERLIRELDVERLAGQDAAAIRGQVEEASRSLLAAEDVPMARQERLKLIAEIADEVLGLGPIQSLLDDASISEVMVNGPDQIYFERNGVLALSDRVFKDDGHILRVIEKIVAPLNRRIDERSPMVDARLPDGSRVNAIIPPLAIDGPTLTIRKFSKVPYQVDDLIRFRTLSAEIVEVLKACIMMRLNIIVSGGTGTGKTTLLNVLSSFIPPTERVITIEDPAELQLRQRHLVRLETRPANIEGEGQISQRELVRNALRMRPDRIVVGEVRGGEAFDMLQAMNTGHDGSLTTVHANTPRDALSRVENMVLMAGLDLPAKAIREQVASAINLIVHLTRMRDGSRRVTNVTEIVGMESQVVTMQDIFVFQARGLDDEGRILGSVLPTGLRPKFAERFEQYGIPLPASLFEGRDF